MFNTLSIAIFVPQHRPKNDILRNFEAYLTSHDNQSITAGRVY